MSKEFNNSEVLVVGIVKDIAKTIDKDFQRLQLSLASFKKIHWFLVESNSVDSSLQKLETLKKSHHNFDYVNLSVVHSNSPRTVAMADARNRCVEEAKRERYSECKFVVVADFNSLNSKLTKESVDSCDSGNDWDAVFANQSGKYYDIWALRHPIWCPNDCWQDLVFFRQISRFPEKALHLAVHSKMINIPKSTEWIRVDSAFGGFGIYRADAYKMGKYVGVTAEQQAVCEHVSFHYDLISRGKKLFINPGLINARSTDHSINANNIQRILRILKYPYKFLKTM